MEKSHLQLQLQQQLQQQVRRPVSRPADEWAGLQPQRVPAATLTTGLLLLLLPLLLGSETASDGRIAGGIVVPGVAELPSQEVRGWAAN